MALIVTLPDRIGTILAEEAKKNGMDVKAYIRLLLTNYATNKAFGTSTSNVSIDLTPVLNELNNIKQALTKIEERLNKLEQKVSYQPKKEYKPYKRYEESEYFEEEEEDPLERAIRYTQQVLANNNNVITDEQLEKIAEKFKVRKSDIVERLFLVEKEPGKWYLQE